MKVVVGLGNPGKEYENTRHNVGFLALDALSHTLGITIKEKKFKALIGEGNFRGTKYILVKPQTYMNLSGESVIEVMKYYKVDIDDLLVISDDLDLTLGSLRLRENGSSGGQKGLKSIMEHLHTQDFNRLRIGIGKNKNIPTVNYVLGKIEEGTAINDAANCAYDFIAGTSILELKNKYNKKVKHEVVK